jgi:ribonucleotide monophosphatase NagD (HAD superfamily)
VLTGVSSRDDLARSPIRPTWIAADLGALIRGEADSSTD